MSTKKKSPGTSRKTSHRKKDRTKAWKVVNPHAAGIDIGATEHYVAVPPDSVPATQGNVQTYGTFSENLDQLVEWLKACKVTTVAMEATGVYWLPVYQKIEQAGMEVILVNAHTLKHVPGRKTDVQDCQWIQQLHTFGLLQGSFRPSDAICRLRTLLRHRATLISQASEHTLHMQKALMQMNVQLHHVLSDLLGETGQRILRAILKGERDPAQLIKLRDVQCTKSTEEQMLQALRGDWREELLFVLKQSFAGWEFCQQQMKECDQQIQKQLKCIPSAPVPPPSQTPAKPDPLASQFTRVKAKQSRKRNEPEMDLSPELLRICGTNLTTAHGFRVINVLVVISEIGVDMSAWRSRKAFCSWLGLCPNNKISGGRILSSRTRKVVNRAATALRMAAVSVAETDTWLGSFYRRMRARLGPAGAVTATAHKIAGMLYHLLKNKAPFVDRDVAAYEEKLNRNKLTRLRNQAARLGFKLVPAAQANQQNKEQQNNKKEEKEQTTQAPETSGFSE